MRIVDLLKNGRLQENKELAEDAVYHSETPSPRILKRIDGVGAPDH